jgi:hypothetical protein
VEFAKREIKVVMKSTLRLVMLAVLLPTSLGGAQDKRESFIFSWVSGNQLHERCQDVKVESSDIVRGTYQEVYDSGICTGFILGIASTLRVKGDAVDWNPPSGVTPPQLMAIVQRYLSNHPESWTFGAVNLVKQAMKEAFPTH